MKKLSLYDLLSEHPAPQSLCPRVLQRVAQAKLHQLRIRFAFQTGLFLISGMIFVPLAQYVGRELLNSGFYEYMSLTFSGNGFVNARQDLGYALIESLPAFLLLALVICFAVVLWSLSHVLRNLRAVFARRLVAPFYEPIL